MGMLEDMSVGVAAMTNVKFKVSAYINHQRTELAGNFVN